MFIMKTTRK